jgi:hypothetical protein
MHRHYGLPVIENIDVVIKHSIQTNPYILRDLQSYPKQRTEEGAASSSLDADRLSSPLSFSHLKSNAGFAKRYLSTHFV